MFCRDFSTRKTEVLSFLILNFILRGVIKVKRFDLYLPIDLFNRVKLMAVKYNISITKMIINLLEVGYLKFLENGGNDNESTHLYRWGNKFA